MRPVTEYHDARRMLVELLRQAGDGPVMGVTELSVTEREFMMATCAATVLLYTICYTAAFDADEAKRGLKALQLEMEKHVDEICDV